MQAHNKSAHPAPATGPTGAKPPNKSIFCYAVYKTNSTAAHARAPAHLKSKSTSAGSSALWQESEVLYVNDKLLNRQQQHAQRRRRHKSRSRAASRDTSTQTSKTIIQLASLETGCMTPDSLSPRDDDDLPAAHDTTVQVFDAQPPAPSSDLIAGFLRRKSTRSRSFATPTTHHPNYIAEPMAQPAPPASSPLPQAGPPPAASGFTLHGRSSKSVNLPDNSSRFKSPSLFYVPNGTFLRSTAASRSKSRRNEVLDTADLIPPMRRGRSISPRPSGDQRRFESSRKIPYIDQSKSDVSSATTIVNTTRNPEVMKRAVVELEAVEASPRGEEPMELMKSVPSPKELKSYESSLAMALNRFRDEDWQVALKGLAELVELCRFADVDEVYYYMTAINQRLIETLKSPRSHVSRTACQAAGHLFEYVKDTRKPEFDDIVDILLFKTADANKFIRQDANMALDCMVTHISTFNAVRALCAKGPFHKNNLVRCATVRLLVCAVVIAGTDFILNINSNDFTRKRLIVNMVRFLEDKNLETRKFAERLYKIMAKDVRFDQYLKKYVDKDQIIKIKRTLKLVHKK